MDGVRLDCGGEGRGVGIRYSERKGISQTVEMEPRKLGSHVGRVEGEGAWGTSHDGGEPEREKERVNRNE